MRLTLGLARARPAALLTGFAFGIGLWFAASLLLHALASDWAPVNNPAMEWLSSNITALAQEPDTAVLLFLGLAVAPAICEEFLFRGVALSAFRQRAKPWVAITVSATLFSLYHLNIYQMPNTFVIGLVLGWLTLRCGSIWPAVLLHALHNGLSLAFHISSPSGGTPSLWLYLLLIGPIAGFVLLRSGLADKPSTSS